MDKKQTNKKINTIGNGSKDNNYNYFPDISNTVSSTECTGMMYALPQNEAEFESYQELFDMQIPKKKDDQTDMAF